MTNLNISLSSYLLHEGHESPDLLVGDEVNPRTLFVLDYIPYENLPQISHFKRGVPLAVRPYRTMFA